MAGLDSLGLGDITSGIGGWVGTAFLWTSIIIFVCAVFIIFLVLQKRKKFKFPTFIFINTGNGKVSITKTMSGWFSNKKTFFGLIEKKGSDEMITKKGIKILNVSASDFHDYDGKLCLLIKRKDDDPKILAPISKAEVEEKLLLEVAPAEYRDASVGIVNKIDDETKGSLEKYLPMIMSGVIIMGGLLSIIFIIQFSNKNLEAMRGLASDQARFIIEHSCTASTAP